MIQRKICLLGAFAVGKTSLAERYVESKFSERYRTTVGVRVHKKSLDIGGEPLNLIIWDLAGEDELVVLRTSYLRGASGYLLVADGTRPDSLDKAIDLQRRAEAAIGETPFLLVLNKADRCEEWTIPTGVIENLQARGWQIVRTSAKSGSGVEEAFRHMAQKLGYG
jgi:small GTP-binding protein